VVFNFLKLMAGKSSGTLLSGSFGHDCQQYCMALPQLETLIIATALLYENNGGKKKLV
jgi:hypothetical protein